MFPEVFLVFFLIKKKTLFLLLPLPYLYPSLELDGRNMGNKMSFYFKGLLPVVKEVFANCGNFVIKRSTKMNKSNSRAPTTQR